MITVDDLFDLFKDFSIKSDSNQRSPEEQQEESRQEEYIRKMHSDSVVLLSGANNSGDNDYNDDDCECETPSLTASNTSCSYQSDSDCNSSSDLDWLTIDADSHLKDGRPVRRVRFDPLVEIREYAVTLGDHPFCDDGVALTLDWRYSPDLMYRRLEDSRERQGAYTAPYRMCYEERRYRIFCMRQRHGQTRNNDDDDDDEDNTSTNSFDEEIDYIMSVLFESWSQASFLPMLHYPDLDEEMDEDEDETEGEMGYEAYDEDEISDGDDRDLNEVIEWQRVSILNSID